MERINLPEEMAKMLATLTAQAAVMQERVTHLNQAKQLALISFAHGKDVNPAHWRLSDDGLALESIIPKPMGVSQMKAELANHGIKLVPPPDRSTPPTESESSCPSFQSTESPRKTECPTDGGWARPPQQSAQSESTPGIESGPMSTL